MGGEVSKQYREEQQMTRDLIRESDNGGHYWEWAKGKNRRKYKKGKGS